MSYLKIEYYENGQIKSVEAHQFMGNIRLKNMEPLGFKLGK